MRGSQREHGCGLRAGRLLLITNRLGFPRRKFYVFRYRQFAESKLQLEDVYAQGELAGWWTDRAEIGTRICFEDSKSKEQFALTCDSLGITCQDG